MTRLYRPALVITSALIAITALTGCAYSPTARTSGSPSSPVHSAPAPTRAASATPAQRDPAVWAAIEFELARCHWDWRNPMPMYVGAQQAYATPAYASTIAASADTQSWNAEVVPEQQQVTCTVSAAHRQIGAPTTATSAFIRLQFDAHVTSTLGSFDAGTAVAAWHVVLTGGRWLVSGPYEGG